MNNHMAGSSEERVWEVEIALGEHPFVVLVSQSKPRNLLRCELTTEMVIEKRYHSAINTKLEMAFRMKFR